MVSYHFARDVKLTAVQAAFLIADLFYSFFKMIVCHFLDANYVCTQYYGVFI